MKSEMDQQAIEEQLYKDGKAEGLAQGEKRVETIARNLLNAGMPAEDVAQMTGLSIEAVVEL